MVELSKAEVEQRKFVLEVSIEQVPAIDVTMMHERHRDSDPLVRKYSSEMDTLNFAVGIDLGVECTSIFSS